MKLFEEYCIKLGTLALLDHLLMYLYILGTNLFETLGWEFP